MPDPEYCNVQELAQLLRVTPKTIRRWVSAGKLPRPLSIVPNGVQRWKTADVRARLAELGGGAQ
jgi:predicted site-specific integrase-resolvase